jgi:hypothetical protein
MTRLTLAFTLLLTTAAAAHAQTPNGNPGSDPLREAMRTGDSAKVEEAHINASRANRLKAESAAATGRSSNRPQTFKAQVEVTNRAAKAIKSVVWTATLTDPDTGSVIRAYDVETKADIAPGKTKRLSERLLTPPATVVNSSAKRPRRTPVADLKVAVKSVTYVDGSTSATP